MMQSGQELPPRGGFAPIPVVRHLPRRGLSSGSLFLGLAALTVYGMYRYVKATKVIIELEREKLQSRLALMPLLMGEEDYAVCRLHAQQRQLERSVGVVDPDAWHRDVYRQPMDDGQTKNGSDGKLGYVPRSIVGSPGHFRILPHQYCLYVNDNVRPYEIKFYGEK